MWPVLNCSLLLMNRGLLFIFLLYFLLPRDLTSRSLLDLTATDMKCVLWDHWISLELPPQLLSVNFIN